MTRTAASVLFRDDVFFAVQRHDIVLEYVENQSTPAQLQEGHRALISMFVDARPPSGWLKRNQIGNPTCFYIANEIQHHVDGACADGEKENELTLQWLVADVRGKFDVISISVALNIGNERVHELASIAEKEKDWFVAAKRTGVACDTMVFQGAEVKIVTAYRARQIEMLKHVSNEDGDETFQFALDTLEMSAIVSILKQWKGSDLPIYLPRIKELLKTEACTQDPHSVYDVQSVALLSPATQESDMDLVIKILHDMTVQMQTIVDNPKVDPDAKRRSKLYVLGCMFTDQRLNPALQRDGYDAVAYLGERGANIEEWIKIYDHKSDHDDFTQLFSANFMVGGSAWSACRSKTPHSNRESAREH